MKRTIALILFSLQSVLNGQNLSVGLQACYPLDLNASNYAPTGPQLNGTLNNVTPAAGHTAVGNTAYKLNGQITSYIELPDNPGLKSDSVFFSGWFYIDSLPNEQYLVYTKNNCSSNFEAYSLITYFNPSSNQQVFRVSKSGSACIYAPQVDSQIAPVIGNWYHVCFYIDNTTIKLYVNGVLQGTSSHTIQFDYQAGKSVFLGVTNESYFDFPFKGRVDDVRFYDRELTPAEVSDLYSHNLMCAQGEITSIKNNPVDKIHVAIYPNPCHERIIIDDIYVKTIEIVDLAGRQVAFEQRSINGTLELNVNNLVDGIYFVKVFNDEGKLEQIFRISKN